MSRPPLGSHQQVALPLFPCGATWIKVLATGSPADISQKDILTCRGAKNGTLTYATAGTPARIPCVLAPVSSH